MAVSLGRSAVTGVQQSAAPQNNRFQVHGTAPPHRFKNVVSEVGFRVRGPTMQGERERAEVRGGRV